MKGFYQRRKQYDNGHIRSVSIDDVIPAKLTLRKNLTDSHLGCRQANIVDRTNEPGFRETPFEEINVSEYSSTVDNDTSDIIAASYIKPELISPEQYTDKIFDLFKRTIKLHWKPEKFKIISHSAGSDSRMISTAIKQLHEELGSEWLGDVMFIEAEGESEGFLEIMKIQGWDDDQYCVMNNDLDPNENQWLALDFENAWKKLNGVLGFPVNVWWDTVLWLQDICGIAPPDDQIQAWTGYGSNEISKAVYHPEQTIPWYFKWHYYHELANFPMKVETVHPFHSFFFISEFLKWIDMENPMEYPTVTCSKKIIPVIAPELSHIDHTPELYKKRDAAGYRTVSDKLMVKNINDYQASWYGKNVNPSLVATNKIEYSRWWGEWCLASFCEHLIEQGCEVEH